MSIWYEILAFCFELDIPKLKPIILEEDFIISFEHPDVNTLKEIRRLITTFDVDVEYNLHSRICWIKVGATNLRKRNYKQFIELLRILVDQKCVEVDNPFEL